jgi:hypothetical protein
VEECQDEVAGQGNVEGDHWGDVARQGDVVVECGQDVDVSSASTG